MHGWIRCALLLLTCWCVEAGQALQLAGGTWVPGRSPAGWLVSEKLDGVRVRWTGQVLLTRGGHPVRAPDWFVAPLPPLPLDGELWAGRGGWGQVMSVLRRHGTTDADWRRLTLMWFDLPASAAGFQDRDRALHALVQDMNVPWIGKIRQFRVADEAMLYRILHEVTRHEGEGLMLHHEQARYRPGRSDQLLKLKQWDDDEALVVGYIEGLGSFRGLMGALVVRGRDGREFRIGTGFKLQDRETPPPLGSLITFRYQGRTPRGLPRFPQYVRVRALPEEPEARAWMEGK